MSPIKINLFDYKLHITVMICVIIAELIGTSTITIGSIHVVLLPLLYSISLAVLCYLIKPIKWISKNQSHTASVLMIILIGPLIAKLAISSGQNIELILKAGPLLILEELGDLGAIIFGLPVALLLGFKRETIGMTSSICREPQMAVLINKYGFESVELKGFMVVYLIGTVFGTIILSILTTVIASVIPLHPLSYAMACGIGSASMNVAGVSSLVALYPGMADNLYAFSAIANLISIVLSIYVYMLISLPLTERIYNFLEKRRKKIEFHKKRGISKKK